MQRNKYCNFRRWICIALTELYPNKNIKISRSSLFHYLTWTVLYTEWRESRAGVHAYVCVCVCTLYTHIQTYIKLHEINTFIHTLEEYSFRITAFVCQAFNKLTSSHSRIIHFDNNKLQTVYRLYINMSIIYHVNIYIYIYISSCKIRFLLRKDKILIASFSTHLYSYTSNFT